ncbi:4-hydroxy-tetrahydrodipicolinate synthase [Capnocytophaga sp. G2]|uniref:4-hydroxy-tetrahydrodipicolinate synthase n=1 Tax=Capnocytophaga sp. G2 TaxID=3110695 RepID=UPI002B480ED0|nr:4-hydroxy-tetrahydrodipicolinate synthase [Capnocytophaga sp. G2]MEB3004180.1 4-hydroxy-tetrahydrodipicolinate synthase [Capnocytophaga sp. G2]
MKKLQGTGVALTTPFKQDKSVDVQALEQLVHFQVENGIDYLVVLGTTAETPTLSTEEKQLVKQTVKRANNGRIPMVLGVGGNDTKAIVEQVQAVEKDDYQAILSVSPYYNKPSQEGIYQHYKAIAQASPLPILLYNVPSRTGINMDYHTTLRLAKEVPNIIGIKEASGNIVQIMHLLQGRPKDFLIISGDDATALPTVLLGGDGVISVLGQAFPKQCSQMIHHGLEAKNNEANASQYHLLEAMDLIFKEGNPVGIKALLSLLGIGTPQVRLPLCTASEQLQKQLKEFLQKMK